MLKRSCYAALLLLTASALFGQDENTVSSARISIVSPTDFFMNIEFTNDVADPPKDIRTDNVSVTTTPATTLAITSVELRGGTRRAVRITFSGTPPTITNAQVCFAHMTFVESSGSRQSVANVCGTAQILNALNLAAQKAQIIQQLQTIPKTKDEKNIFASGFITTASSGTAGGLALDLNSNNLGIPGMTAFLRTDKTSAPGGDPKNFEFGTTFRNAYVFGGSDLNEMRKKIAVLHDSTADAAQQSAASTDINNLEAKVQKRIFSALIVDFSGKVEGGASDFHVANYVGDGLLSLQSRTQTLFGSRNGFWQFRLVPGGMEGGKNIQSNASTTEAGAVGTQQFVARYKGGAQFSLYYDNPASLLPFKRIQLDVNTVQRFLFFKEAEILSPSAKPILADGHRPWYQVEGLIYLAEAPSGRYGFRLTYNNGSLPPNFATTKSFQFGFVFETAEADGNKATH